MKGSILIFISLATALVEISGFVLKSPDGNEEISSSKWKYDLSTDQRVIGVDSESHKAADYIGPYGAEDNSFLLRHSPPIRRNRITRSELRRYKPYRGGGFGIPYGYIIARMM